MERVVEDVDPPLPGIGGVEEVPRGGAFHVQAGVSGQRGCPYHLGRRAEAVVPGGYGAVRVGVDERGGRAVHQERRGIIAGLSAGPWLSGRGGGDRRRLR